MTQEHNDFGLRTIYNISDQWMNGMLAIMKKYGEEWDTIRKEQLTRAKAIANDGMAFMGEMVELAQTQQKTAMEWMEKTIKEGLDHFRTVV